MFADALERTSLLVMRHDGLQSALRRRAGDWALVPLAEQDGPAYPLADSFEGLRPSINPRPPCRWRECQGIFERLRGISPSGNPLPGHPQRLIAEVDKRAVKDVIDEPSPTRIDLRYE